MSKKLVIVESPAKAKTIARFLSDDFVVMSSYGHIRDLPEKKMGIDIDNNFKPQYVIPAKAKKNVDEIKKQALKTNKIYLATDEDREGEAIAWHLLNILNLTDDNQKNNSVDYERIVFHEITRSAILTAIKRPRKIDFNLVDAQQARRILDRLVGYELSPFLWKKVAKGLSAGRVQSVAVRLIIEREREIQNFKPTEYWTVEAELSQKNNSSQTFIAKLNKIAGKNIDKLFIKNKDQAEKIKNNLEKNDFQITKIEKKQTTKKPLPPFTTSTLQQEASKKLGFSAKQTMAVAQKLYEGIALGAEEQTGLITYMRTDSLNLSEKFLSESRDFINNKFGANYLPPTSRTFKAKSKLAQEAHEAIRPTETKFEPTTVAKFLDRNQLRLYELIWNRALASQMEAATFDSTSIDIKNGDYSLRATGSQLKFDGFLKIYPESTKDNLLPDLKEKDILATKKIITEQHFTEPPARYNDASIVKKLEELEIGRPSTYAPTLSTIINRGYVKREDKKFFPQDIAFVVNDLLVEHFPKIVDYSFTAKMENEFDEIAAGKLKWQPLISNFYMPFKNNLKNKEKEIKKSDLINEESDEICDKCGAPMLIKTGRFGKFLACSAFPKCKNTKAIIKEGDNAQNDNQELNPDHEKCPECGKELVVKQSRFGKFLACSGYPDCKFIKNNFSTGVECPLCHQGKIMMRKTKKGRIFYGCSAYPNCNYALWQKPIEDPNKKGHGLPCPKCQSLLIEAGKNKIKCSNKECNFEQAKEKE